MSKVLPERSPSGQSSFNALEKLVGGAVAAYVVVDTIRAARRWSRVKGSVEPNTGDYYDAFASRYDVYADEADWPAKAAGFIRTAAEIKGADTIETFLDLGAGTGYSVDAAKAVARPSRIVAVDVSSAMLAQLEERDDGSPAVKTVLSPIESYIRQTDEKFDLITSMSALEFVPELPEVLGEVPHLLNPGGVFAATYVARKQGQDRKTVNESPLLAQKLEEYVWFPQEIEGSLTASGLTILHRDNSQAAYQLGSKTVNYNFIVAAKPESA